MKKIKTLCAVCAMAMCFSTLSVTASAEETSGGAALTREQCNGNRRIPYRSPGYGRIQGVYLGYGKRKRIDGERR